jgi:hypothetical protein
MTFDERQTRKQNLRDLAHQLYTICNLIFEWKRALIELDVCREKWKRESKITGSLIKTDPLGSISLTVITTRRQRAVSLSATLFGQSWCAKAALSVCQNCASLSELSLLIVLFRSLQSHINWIIFFCIGDAAHGCMVCNRDFRTSSSIYRGTTSWKRHL